MPAAKTKITKELEKQIIDDVLLGIKKRDIFNKYNISRFQLLRISKKNNIWQKYAQYRLINENCFDNIDTEWKAYFLGLFYADGCITRHGGAEINLRDEDILQRLSKEIFVNKPVNKYLNYNSWAYLLKIDNRYIIDSFRKIGLTERKSLTIDFPECMINSLFLGDFIRGYFDGDGSISESRYTLRNLRHQYSVNFCVSEKFGRKLQEILSQKNIICCFRVQSGGKIHVLSLSEKLSIFNLYQFLYKKDTQFFLQRKKVKFDNFIKENPIIKKQKFHSKHKGISFEKNLISKPWSAVIYNKKLKKRIRIGRFPTEDTAYAARQEYLRQNNILEII